MRQLLTVLLLLSSVAPRLVAGQVRGRGTAASALSACALLTKEVVMQVSPLDKKALDIGLRVPATEDAVGRGGTECSYGGITMNVDAFVPASIERTLDKTWVPVSGVGDAARFHDNRGEYAELYVRVGTHALTIQMDTPPGRTPASIQSNVIALAKLIVPKLR